MNKEQLDAIKERIAKATPGEWSTELCYDRLIGTYLLLTDKGELVLSTYDNPTKQDAKFIAHARQDVPALVAEVERLQQFEQKAIYTIEENKRLREALNFYADESNHTEPRGKNIFGDIFYDKGKTARQALEEK